MGCTTVQKMHKMQSCEMVGVQGAFRHPTGGRQGAGRNVAGIPWYC